MWNLFFAFAWFNGKKTLPQGTGMLLVPCQFIHMFFDYSYKKNFIHNPLYTTNDHSIKRRESQQINIVII
ncbi:hypothetical protein MALU111345_02530 [Marinicrinis lubricantis]